MFVKHNDYLIDISKIAYIKVREKLIELIIYFSGDLKLTIHFESLEDLNRFTDSLNDNY